MRLDRLQQELEGRSALLRAGGDVGPNVFAPAAPGFAPRALRNPAVDNCEADRLFRQVVRRFDARRGNESKVRSAVLVLPSSQVLGVLDLRNAGGRHTKDLVAGRFQLLGKPDLAELVATVDHCEQSPQGPADTLALSLLLVARQRGEELHVTDQMSRAGLNQHTKRVHEREIGEESAVSFPQISSRLIPSGKSGIRPVSLISTSPWTQS